MRSLLAKALSVGTGLLAGTVACNQLWGIEEPYDRVDGSAQAGKTSWPPENDATSPPPSEAGNTDRDWTPYRRPTDASAPRDSGADAWAEAGLSPPCEDGGLVCTPGAVEPGTEKCGDCDLGRRTRSRTCQPDGCGWSEWTAWSECTGSTAECPAGKVEPKSQPCGWCNSGTQTQTRTCGNDCKWGPWSAFGACGDVTAECAPNSYRCCGAGKWEWCYLNSCKWTGGCAACTNCGC